MHARVLVLAHCYYADLWSELDDALRNLGDLSHDLFVTLPEDRPDSWRQGRKILKAWPGCKVLMVENRGQDIGAALHAVSCVDLSRYDLVLKIHTKKGGSHLEPGEGDAWRQGLIDPILGTRQRVDDIVNQMMADRSIGMVGGRRWVRSDLTSPINETNINYLTDRLGLPPRKPDDLFVAGTIFWTRPDVFAQLLRAGVNQQELHLGYQVDATITHALERVLGLLAVVDNRRILAVD